MALNDLTMPKTIGTLDAIETQKLRHRLLALGNRYTGDKENNIFTHIASESKKLYQEKNDYSHNKEYFDKQVEQLHAKLGAGLNVVAQSHGDYDPNIKMDTLICADKTKQITRSAFNVLQHDPRPLIKSWDVRINENSSLNFDSVFQPSADQTNELIKKVDKYNSQKKFSTIGESLLYQMQTLQDTPLSIFTKNNGNWDIPKTDYSRIITDNVATASAIAADTSWSDIVNNVITGIDFVNDAIVEITTNTFVDSIMDIMVDFVIDFALDSFTFGLWTIGRFIINIFTGGLGFF